MIQDNVFHRVYGLFYVNKQLEIENAKQKQTNLHFKDLEMLFKLYTQIPKRLIGTDLLVVQSYFLLFSSSSLVYTVNFVLKFLASKSKMCLHFIFY